MLLQINNINLEIDKIINESCGKSYSFIQRIIKSNYGSNRYQLLNISTNKYNIELFKYNDSIYLNFDLRDRGIVFYFRYLNTEYVEFCPYNLLTFQSSNYSFVIQTDKNIYSFKILKLKDHKKFIKKIYVFKSNLKSLSEETLE